MKNLNSDNNDLLSPILDITNNGYRDCLFGWNELSQWALYNDPLWRASLEASKSLSDFDQLRFMLGAYVNELERVKKAYEDYVRDNPPSTLTGPNGEVYRYVGP